MKTSEGYQIVDQIVQAEIKIKPEARLFDFCDIHINDHTPDILKRGVYLLNKKKENIALLGGDLINAQSMSRFPQQPKLTFPEIEGEISVLMQDLIKPAGMQTYGVVWGNHEENLFRPERRGSIDILSGHLSIAEELRSMNPEVTVAPLMRGITFFIHCGKQTYKMYYAHGTGYLGHSYWGEFDKARMQFPDIDVYFLHHSHLKNHMTYPFIHSEDKTQRVSEYVRGGTYTGYLPYQEKKFLPTALQGSVTMKFHPQKHKIDFDFTE